MLPGRSVARTLVAGVMEFVKHGRVPSGRRQRARPVAPDDHDCRVVGSRNGLRRGDDEFGERLVDVVCERLFLKVPSQLGDVENDRIGGICRHSCFSDRGADGDDVIFPPSGITSKHVPLQTEHVLPFCVHSMPHR